MEILTAELIWAPECDDVGADGIISFKIADQTDEYLRRGVYSVPHYTDAESLGRAFGPLALDQTLWFCQLLSDRITSSGGCKVALCTPPGDLAARANAAVLLGAFLILRRSWSLQKMVSVLRREAEICFVCSWSGSGRASTGPHRPDRLRVRDCWAGLKAAMDLGFIDSQALEDRLKSELTCGQYRQMALQYDASWLVPGRLLVSADPVTVMQDPNPATFSELLPNADAGAVASEVLDRRVRSLQKHSGPGKQVKEEPDSLSMMVNLYNPSRGVRARPAPTSGCASEPLESSATDDGDVFMDEQASRAATSDTARERPCISSLFAEEVPPGSLPQVPLKSRARGAGKDDDATDSDHTVAKVYGNVEGDSRAPRPADWVSFCQRHGVGLIVRANFGDEKGISEHGGSYDPALLQPFGLKHLDVPIDDRHGAVPDARKIHDLLECCSAHSSRGGVGEHDDEAILLHCKGGFGRSVLLASCLIVAKYDLPGRSILGWVRIARPGAIITYQQERFLCSFGGRADW
eukprot:CAMPEP_0115077090 /NCGR_PEP_ID=MMETSP0227-20121206/16792_1 /TAXON_ID=89957 /ORGANISM="Polarella glacialis, Strain CCMP 1383" /LENGTH=520 /DNA_ID=CAMNT_0002464309 /DNA_START=33 /DNA_END=1592 /DNA_ORIENTATION=+